MKHAIKIQQYICNIQTYTSIKKSYNIIKNSKNASYSLKCSNNNILITDYLTIKNFICIYQYCDHKVTTSN